MIQAGYNVGILDNRCLARSIGYLDPPLPIVVKESAALRDVMQIMKDRPDGCVVVVNIDGVISGIFSDRDVVLRLILADVDLDKDQIGNLMTREPETAQMTTTFAYVLNMMSKGGYRHVPIVDEEQRPVGMVSVKNIVDYIVQEMDKDVNRLTLPLT